VNRLPGISFVGISLLLLLTFVDFGCGSSSTKLRLLNAAPGEASLDALVDSKSVVTGIAYASASGYVSVSSGSRHVQVEPTGTSSPVIDETISLASGNTYTLMAGTFASNITGVLLTDNNSTPPSGDANIRIVNAAPSLGSADVYVVSPGTDLSSLSPTISSLSLNTASNYQSLTAGNYEVYFTFPGQKFASIDSGPLTLSAGQVRTVVGLNGTVNGFTATVLDDLN